MSEGSNEMTGLGSKTAEGLVDAYLSWWRSLTREEFALIVEAGVEWKREQAERIIALAKEVK